MFNSFVLVYFLLSSRVIFCSGIDLAPYPASRTAPTTTTAKSPPRGNDGQGLPCETLLLYLEIICGVLIFTVVAESTALTICFYRRRRQNVIGKKADSCTETDNYQEYEENGSDYETLSNDYKPIPPPLETMPKARRVITKVLPMCEIQHTPKQTGPYEGESRSLERPSSQTLPLPVRRHRMLQPASRRPMMPPAPPSPIPPAPPSPIPQPGPRNRTQAPVPRNPLLPPAPHSPMLPQVERNPRVLVPCSPPQFRLPPQALHLPLSQPSQSIAPGKLHFPIPSLQTPPASSKYCHPTRPPAPLPKNISSHDNSDDEWSFETIYY